MRKLLSLLTISVLSASSITTVISCSGPKAPETANQLVNKIASGTSGKTFSIANSTDLTVAGDKTIIINKIVSVLSLTSKEKTMLTNGTITGNNFIADGSTQDPLTIIPKDSNGPATNKVIINFTMDKKEGAKTANELVDKITSGAVGKTFSIAYSTDLTVAGNKTIIINKIVSVLSLTGPENTMLTNGTITGSPFVADGLTKDPLIITPKDSTGPATKTASLDFTMDKKVAPIPGVNGLGKDKSVPFFDVTTADLVNPVSPDLAYNQFQTHNLMLAFVNTTNGKASWTPSDMFDNRSTKEAQWINQYETLGGHVGISFGGATGSQTGTLPWNVMTEQQLVQTFTEGIKLYNAQAFDFDIESAVGFEPEGFAKLINAINDIKTTYSKLDISFTFASLPIDKWGIKFWGSTSDLSSTSVPLLKKLKFAPIINPMAFDFGRYYTPTKAKYIPNIENVVETAYAYWASIFNINADTFLKNNLELSIMIGRSDQDRQETVLAPTDVQTLSTYAKTKNLFRMGFWCLNRDFPGEFEPVDEHNSGTNNPAGIYSQTIKKYFE